LSVTKESEELSCVRFVSEQNVAALVMILSYFSQRVQLIMEKKDV